MNEEAREGRYAPCIGRKEEIDLVIRTLTQPKNKSLVFVGEPGIGKTAVFEEIARRIAAGENSVASIKDLTFYWVDVTALTATQGYVGQLSTKVTEMINFSKQREGTCVLVIDELHQLRGAGRSVDNKTDLFEMVKNSLSKGQIIVLGTSNNYLWDPIVLEDPAINRRIRSHHMLPPSLQVCYDMLKTINDSGFYTKGYEPAYVKITDEAITAAIFLSEYWMKDQFLPDKATVLLSSAVSYYQQGAKNIEITPREIASVLYDAIKHRLKENTTKDEFIRTLLSTPKSTPKDGASSAELLSCADL
jgi:ATP-dependent Clp protease ATP-binding subunit ClpB